MPISHFAVLLLHCSLNQNVNIPDCMESNGRIINEELETTSREVLVVYFQVLFRLPPEKTE
jgi:hypothetical protein